MLTVAAMLMCATPALAQDDATLDELLNLPTQRPPAQAPADQTPADAAGGEGPLRPEVRRLVNEGDAADTLEAALRQMEGVASRLVDRLDPGLDTQREQESILRKLDQVIAAARQQQSSSSSSSSGSSGGQARQQDVGGESVAQQQAAGQQSQPGAPGAAGEAEQAGSAENRGEDGTGGRPPGDPRDQPLEELRKEWGNLPPRLRDELTEGLNEEFSPAYRELTEQYYRALAEEE